MTRVRIDWFRVIVEIERAAAWSARRIAAEIGVPGTTLIGWRNLLAEPRHADGERLIALWCRMQPEVLKNPRAALPLNVDDLMSAAEAHRKSPKKSGNRAPAGNILASSFNSSHPKGTLHEQAHRSGPRTRCTDARPCG